MRRPSKLFSIGYSDWNVNLTNLLSSSAEVGSCGAVPPFSIGLHSVMLNLLS
jgi:hypothetical protein